MFQKKKNKPKIFCIGANKTGTTSVEKALSDLGYRMGDQAQGELLLPHYVARNFKPIIKHCYTADAFQDAPFSFHDTYKYLDAHFRNARFIFTVRDSDEQWYRSLLRFHIQLFMKGERVPTVADLKKVKYRYPGYVWEVRQQVFGFTEEEDPYDPVKWKAYYNTHNTAVRDYFKNKEHFIELNLSEKDAYLRLCKFLGKEPLYESFPWENRSDIIKK